MVFEKNFNSKKAIKNFRRLLRYRTVAGNKAAFAGFREGIKEMYPLIHQTCTLELFGTQKSAAKGLMYLWKGRSSKNSIVLMSHYDVVPADTAEWLHPPFSGTEADGYIYGRGVLDTKGTFCALMESVEALIEQGFTPEADIYLCFGGDEETTGSNAVLMAQALEQRGVRPYLILDEGGAVVDGTLAGINHACALVGIAEKGYMDVEFITKSKGGHSSITSTANPIITMAQVICRINPGIFKSRMSKPLKIMIDSAAQHTDIIYIKLLSKYPFLKKIFKKAFIKKLPEVEALIKTIGSITQISGGNAENVIPEQIRAVGNFRIISESSVEETLSVIKNALKGIDVEVNVLENLEPSKISETSGQGWDALASAIAKTWEGSVLIPYLMLARSDSRSYSNISDNIYRFTPVTMTNDERVSIHGVNERISVEGFLRIIEFFICLIKDN